VIKSKLDEVNNRYKK